MIQLWRYFLLIFLLIFFSLSITPLIVIAFSNDFIRYGSCKYICIVFFNYQKCNVDGHLDAFPS